MNNTLDIKNELTFVTVNYVTIAHMTNAVILTRSKISLISQNKIL